VREDNPLYKVGVKLLIVDTLKSAVDTKFAAVIVEYAVIEDGGGGGTGAPAGRKKLVAVFIFV
jgi:hypothetical protein